MQMTVSLRIFASVMDLTVFFADKSVVFARKLPREGAFCFRPADCGEITRDKIVNFLRTHNSVAVSRVLPKISSGSKLRAASLRIRRASG